MEPREDRYQVMEGPGRWQKGSRKKRAVGYDWLGADFRNRACNNIDIFGNPMLQDKVRR